MPSTSFTGFLALRALLLLALVTLVTSQQYVGDVIPNSLPQVAGSTLTYYKIKDPKGSNASLTLTNYISTNVAGGKVDGPKVKRAIIVIHGLDRDPQTYISAMLSALSVAGATDPTVNQDSVAIMAPYFPNGNDKNIGYPWIAGLSAGKGSNTSALVWQSSGFAEGANNQYPYKTTTVSSFAVLDTLIGYFNDPTIFPNIQQIVIAGHSLGAQAVNRYVAVGNDLSVRVPISYYIANPNSYVWFTTTRPFDTSTCPTYDDWRDGFNGYSSDNSYGVSLVAQGRPAVLAHYNSRSVAYARGTLDLGDDSTTCAPSTTGANRNERFFQFIKNFPPTCSVGGVCDTIDYVVAGHDAGAMFSSTSGQYRLFLDNFNGDGSRHYDIGYPRQQAGDDPYPDPSQANNATNTTGPAVYAGNMTYAGCYSDQEPQSLTYMAYSNNANTIELCTSTCDTAGYTIAGLEFGVECYCGNELTSKATQGVDIGCTQACAGNSSEICGAGNRLSLFSNGVPKQASSPSLPSSVGTYALQGCYTEATTGRALSSLATSGTTNDLESCAAFCAGYAYFGSEYGDECYCGNSINAGSVNTTITDCSMLCANNPLELCGAANRLSLYKSNSTVTNPTTSSAAGSPTSTALSCPGSDQTVYTTTDGKKFLIECGIDHAGGDLSNVVATSLEACISACDTTSGCQAFSWTSGGGNVCYMKNSIGSGGSNVVIWGGKLISGGAASSLSLSATATASSTAPAATSTDISCPASNGMTFNATSGHTFLIECGVDHAGDSTLAYVSTLAACINACDAQVGCQAYSWMGNSNNVVSPCYMKNTIGAGTSNSNVWGGRLISAGSSSGSSPATSTSASKSSTTTAVTGAQTSLSCPGSNGVFYNGTSGHTFQIECSVDHAGDSTLTYVSSLAACINSCDTMAGCQAFSWVGNSNNVASPCYMKTIIGAGTTNTQVWGGKLVALGSGSGSSSSLSSSSATTTVATTTASVAPATSTLSCPGSNGVAFNTTQGRTFLVECGVDHGGDSTLAYVPTLNGCIAACGASPSCQAFSWVGNSNNVNSPCYMKSVIGAAASNSGIWGGKLIASGAGGATSSSSTTSSVAPAATGLMCPDSNGTVYTSQSGAKYQVLCLPV